MGLWVAVVAVALAGVADACMNCTFENECAIGYHGALLCFSAPLACAQVGKCAFYVMSDGGGGDAGTIDFTLLEGAGLPLGERTHRARLAGGIAVGHTAARAAGEALGSRREPEVLYSATGFSEECTVAFRSPSGDGFTLQRENVGREARLTVSALSGHHAGRVLAQEQLGADEALVVHVPFEGRMRVLVVSATRRPLAEATAHQAAARRELASDAGTMGRQPPFAMEVVEP
jgi:hypothetical protein